MIINDCQSGWRPNYDMKMSSALSLSFGAPGSLIFGVAHQKGSRVKGQGSRVKGTGSRVKGQGSRVKGQGLRVKG